MKRRHNIIQGLSDRREFLKKLALAAPAAGVALYLMQQQAGAVKAEKAPGCGDAPEKLVKTEEEWKKELTPEQFRILRKKGTERPFSSALNENKKKGIYTCAGCDLPLFSSEHKFDSGTGWPSFYKPICPENVAEKRDLSLFMVRTEVLCARCDGHLGHVFEDGPEPTGLRYCINGDSLNFKEK